MKTRFLIVGLPRSGTTYLMTLLNSHAAISCQGEIFNPHGIVGAGWVNRKPVDLMTRDREPKQFLDGFFSWDVHGDADAVGGKWMIGHHPEIMNAIAGDPQLRIINVFRENKLAQASSHLKAQQTNQWATADASKVDHAPLPAGPRMIAQRVREQVTYDRLFGLWLQELRNPVMSVTYREMFAPGFNNRICDALNMSCSNEMRSKLVKQGSNDILSRFEKKLQIANYFRQVGLGHWLEPEL